MSLTLIHVQQAVTLEVVRRWLGLVALLQLDVFKFGHRVHVLDLCCHLLNFAGSPLLFGHRVVHVLVR